MNEPWAVANASFLFLCTSMYLGTGWSLVLFQFPIASQLTTANYYSHFVPQVEAATRFFTFMTMAMLVSGGVMVFSEWGEGYLWVPVVVLAGIVAATLLTMRFILPFNERMKAGITDERELARVLRRWTALNRARVGLWTIQWGAMMVWFMGNSW